MKIILVVLSIYSAVVLGDTIPHCGVYPFSPTSDTNTYHSVYLEDKIRSCKDQKESVMGKYVLVAKKQGNRIYMDSQTEKLWIMPMNELLTGNTHTSANYHIAKAYCSDVLTHSFFGEFRRRSAPDKVIKFDLPTRGDFSEALKNDFANSLLIALYPKISKSNDTFWTRSVHNENKDHRTLFMPSPRIEAQPFGAFTYISCGIITGCTLSHDNFLCSERD